MAGSSQRRQPGLGHMLQDEPDMAAIGLALLAVAFAAAVVAALVSQ